MLVLDKYLDDTDNEEVDLPPSYYDTITIASSSIVIDEKPRPSPPTAPRPTAPSSSSTWFSFLPNARIKQTHQTVISLLHDLSSNNPPLKDTLPSTGPFLIARISSLICSNTQVHSTMLVLLTSVLPVLRAAIKFCLGSFAGESCRL
ncbi:hypothetical protein CY34DRAFT_809078 [Suillus luteus UH-Slu-Lm8-n1]|uniref:Uncharacterized protein n=1 Tax=Suillus luteus UH-Slu-Lm8-n1 TaxID=930992 RepID=A0A0C9ZM50_9AGAM|nr:hypothetical protein CY34DRAFT_809078 [Suillus luteus UH-Slu-Lm8-n1]